VTTRPTKVPAIPKPPAKVDPETRAYLESLKEAIEIRLGRRGEPEDRAVTLRELIASGCAKRLESAPFDTNNVSQNNTGFENPISIVNATMPPAPTGFTASGAYSVINLSWDIPSNLTFLSHVEIWVNTSDDSGAAQLLDIETGSSYSHAVGGGQTRYYWIRFISQAEIVGPFNDSVGTEASTATDVTHQLTVLNDAITSSELAESLSTPIGNLPSDTAALITNLDGQYAVKIDNNGSIAGFGFASTENDSGNATSDFIIAADKFALMPSTNDAIADWAAGTGYNVGDQVKAASNYYICIEDHTAVEPHLPNTVVGAGYWNQTNKMPFSVATSPQTVTVGGENVTIDPGVYIDAAFIKDATITAAQIGSIDADTITSGNISADIIDTGTINVSNVNISGTTSTGLNIKSADSGERMEITNDSIKVYDNSGTLRVHIGNI